MSEAYTTMSTIYVVCSGEQAAFEAEGPGWTDCLIEAAFDAEHKAEVCAKMFRDEDDSRSVKLGKPYTTVYWVEEIKVQG